MIRKNIIKEKLKKGEILLGTWCILPSESSVNVLGASGLDFVIIDMEHGTMSIFIVEGKNGLENLDSIIEDKDIDVIYLGLCDISQSIGLPGQITHPKVKDAVLRAVAKVREKGISVGAFTDNQEQLKWFKEIGIQFITYSLEVTELFRIFKKIIQDFKGV